MPGPLDESSWSPRTPRRALLQRVLEIAISLGFLIWAFSRINFRDLWAALRGAHYVWLLPAVLVTILLLILKGWRWQLLFRPEHRIPYNSVFTSLCAGYLASNVLPARLGEVVRMVLLVSEQPVSVARTLSTIVVERLLDVLTLIVVLVALLPFVRLSADMMRAAEILAGVALAGAIVMVLLSYRKPRLLGWSHALLRHIRLLDRPGVYDALGHLIDGFATLRGRLGVLLILTSLLGWVGVTAVAWFAAKAIQGLDAPLTAVTFAVVVTTLGMLVPSSPGYVGVFHGLVIVALASFGIPKDLALSYALVWHATNYVTLSGSGVLALWAHGTSLGRVLQRWRAHGGAVDTVAP